MQYSNISFETSEDGIATLTVCRPDKLNALDNATMEEIDDALQRVAREPEHRALILTGAGEKAFVAGADINELVNVTPLEWKARCTRDHAILRRLESLPKASLAAINGYALGGGLELALSCTLRVAAENARLGLPEVRIGVFPGNGGTQRLPRLVGRGRALEMMLTGKLIDAAEAERIGLVNRVVPQAELLPYCRGLLKTIAENAPVAAALILECVDVGLRCGLEEGLRFEAAASAAVAASEDRREGTLAFLEKRRPVFRGR
ncbi:MAG: enoyl-CoA hydratase/isomerase family protein [Acidobacteria bacterium]|nr:enoyl-CoA hydratase/isomerase family protein [Acidobacteriota bacterium]